MILKIFDVIEVIYISLSLSKKIVFYQKNVYIGDVI